jgi:hypothetical protein
MEMTAEHGTARLFTIFAAIVAWCGLLLQLYLSLSLTTANGKTIVEGLIIYFAYFTILTNLLVALVLTVPLLAPASRAGRFFTRPGVATATAAAITVVGLAYFLLLRKTWNPQGWQLAADEILHYLTPILFLVYWWISVPKQGLRWSQVGAWMSYPIGYLVYMLIRGELTGHYPYYFVDVSKIGYARTLTNALGILAGFVLMSLLLVLVGRWQNLTAGADSSQQQHAADGVARRR